MYATRSPVSPEQRRPEVVSNNHVCLVQSQPLHAVKYPAVSLALVALQDAVCQYCAPLYTGSTDASPMSYRYAYPRFTANAVPYPASEIPPGKQVRVTSLVHTPSPLRLHDPLKHVQLTRTNLRHAFHGSPAVLSAGTMLYPRYCQPPVQVETHNKVLRPHPQD